MQFFLGQITVPRTNEYLKSKHVQLAVRALVRERLTKYKHFFAQHIVDLMQQRGWLTIDESDQKMFASALRSALPLSSWILPW